MTSPPAVQLQRASRCFGEPGGTLVRAVDDVTLELARGSLAVVTGPSGSGKTTLLSLMAGLLPPTDGTVSIDGMALQALSQAALTSLRLRRVGIVFQAHHLVQALTVRENIELPMQLAGVSRAASHARALQLAAACGVAHRVTSAPWGLSGGEQQRVAIARALANDPPLLLADEPTGSLDEPGGASVIALLREQAAHGRTVVVVSHDARFLPVATRVVRMAFGRVVPEERA